MKNTHQSTKNYLFIFSIFFLFPVNAQEHKEDLALKTLDALVGEIKHSLTSNTLTATERDQIYDIVGSLGLCRPVVQTVLEQLATQMPSPPTATSDLAPTSDQDPPLQSQGPDHTSKTLPDIAPAQQISAIEMILNKFDILKQHVIQQLTDHKIEAAHHESAYTLIGSMNLCRSILKGADLLSDKIKAEASISKDQPYSTPDLEQPLPMPNSSTLPLDAAIPAAS